MRKLFVLIFTFAFAFSISAQNKADEMHPKNLRDANIKAPTHQLNQHRTTDRAILLQESFESDFPPAGWTLSTFNTGDPTYTWYQGANAYDGAANCEVLYAADVTQQDEWMISPAVDLTSLSAASLSFWWFTSYYWMVDPNDNGTLSAQITTDGGATWNVLWTEQDAGVFDSWTYYQTVVDLTPYVGNVVQIGFNYYALDAAQADFDMVEITDGAACTISAASNPSPADGMGGVDPMGVTLTWDNDPNATSVDVWVDDGTGWVNVSTGTLISSWSLGDLPYGATYTWAVDEYLDADCYKIGSEWTFSTMNDVSDCIFYDDFENGLGNWIVDGGEGGGEPCQWMLDDGTTAPSVTLPSTSSGFFAMANSDACGSGFASEMVLAAPIDFSAASAANISFDYDNNNFEAGEVGEVYVSVDGGATWTNIASYGEDLRAQSASIDITSEVVGYSSVLFKFYYNAPGWDWWFAIDNVCITGGIVPVELTSFNANVVDGSVTLNWTTATETNNKGFSIERSSDNVEFTEIAFVDGNGTTTEKSTYSYTDNVASGNYFYRLKQVDFNGTYEYSDVVEANVELPKEFALMQNYPNPFNPTTTMKFSLPVDAKVTVKLFNMLGQEVAQMISANYAAGTHQFEFNASNLTSGVYFYTMEAVGADGQNFVATKKLMLMK